MKNFKLVLKAFMVFALLIPFQSCEDEEKNRLDEFQLGGFVRFETPFPTVVNIASLAEAANITITNVLEAPDGNVASYSIEVSAVVAGEEYGPVPFGETVTSFPANLTITMSDLASALGFDIADVGFADTFSFTGTAVNNNGIVYSSDPLTYDSDTKVAAGGNSSGDLLSEAGYRNAFAFSFAIPCPPNNNPINGDWIIAMTDLFGDGWDGAFVTVEIDGAMTDYTVADGDFANHTINVPAGTGVLRISYTSGSWEEEHVYTITNPDGVEFGPFGPEPGTCPEYTSP
ncbi:hypothetical protein L3X37_03885 [Sabulilitoribacter arenilitoris]|uniref:Uncharacterized protein n=1 Tax=Wocania arenilitoris TaxID=2044858 RepID=A0AAE3JKS6_9FLAO|nr:hypothetical protein [Wocania arenilitoris]MCF7567504.1 hypothetical protein [Wocania arenilitoris]